MKRILFVVAIAAAAAPAEAHWQWTKWGMSPAQVIAASKGTVEHADPAADETMPYGVKEAVGTYDSNGRSMKASFWFKAGKLSQINLSSGDQDDCFSIRRDLGSLYGQPLSRSSMSTVWSDKAKGNRVQLVDWGAQGCDLVYAPLATSQSTGL
jgi:hypothetical protein